LTTSIEELQQDNEMKRRTGLFC